MELRHLNYFVAVAEELSFTRAAARLNMAQPPLSVQIRALEAELGVALFDRSNRRVALTEAGHVFLDEARRTLGLAHQAIERARAVGLGQAGHLRLGSVYSAVFAIVPTILRLLGREYPQIKVDLAELTVQQQLDALQQGEIDIGILRSPISNDRIETRLLFREGIVALVPRDHPLAGRGRIALADLVGQPFILSGIGLNSSFRQHILGAFQRRGLELDITREVAEIHSIISLVGAGLGVALAPASVRNIGFDPVVYLDIEDEMPPIEVSLAWLSGTRPPALDSFLALLDQPELLERLAALERSHIR